MNRILLFLIFVLSLKMAQAQKPERVVSVLTNTQHRVTFREIGIEKPEMLPLPEKFALALVPVTNEFGNGSALFGVFQEIPQGITFEKMHVTVSDDMLFIYKDKTGKPYITKISGDELRDRVREIWKKEKWHGPVHLYFEKEVQLDIFRSPPPKLDPRQFNKTNTT